MNDHGCKVCSGDKFKLGADATVAAGPVGRHASAGTDIRLKAEILFCSRSKGVFAGVSLNGSVVQADKSGDRALYGDKANRHEILNGDVPVPEAARPLGREIARYVEEAKAS